MFTRRRILIILSIVVFTNTITFFVVDHMSRLDEYKSTSKVFIKAMSEYLVMLNHDERELVQTMMSGYVYSEILAAGGEDDIRDKVYLCPSWDNGLEDIISVNMSLTVFPERQEDSEKTALNELYKKGAQRMDTLCGNNKKID